MDGTTIAIILVVAFSLWSAFFGWLLATKIDD
jgi:hypothetical protein